MRVGSSLTPQNCQVTKMNSYNTKQLDTVYTIKKKLLEINFWNDVVNNYFHDLNTPSKEDTYGVKKLTAQKVLVLNK